jgi:hypothetical protein
MKTLFSGKNRISEGFLKGPAHIFYHIVVVALSAAFALSLPFMATFAAQKFLVYWSFIGNEKRFLIYVEVALTVFLILFSHYLVRSWKDRKLSNMARAAGLVFVTPTKGFWARRRIRKWKERQGFARDVMIIGSTGFRTLVNPKGDLYQVIQNCREAKIMLLNPNSEGAKSRAKSILSPDITPESFGGQIRKTIDFLKRLKALQKNIRLKLYPDPPFLKLTILGDFLWIQHYHAGLDVQMMPKYLFKHNQNSGSLYSPFYQYFLARWNHPDIPEYDFATDELIYRDTDGNEVRREKFEDPMEDTWREAENESPRDVERKLAEINQDSSETVEKGIKRRF